MTYSSHNLLDEARQARVDIVSNHADGLARTRLDVAGHVLLQHGLDDLAAVLVVCEHGLAAQEAGLFGRVPVELDGVGRLAGCDAGVGEEDAQGFQDCYLRTSVNYAISFPWYGERRVEGKGYFRNTYTSTPIIIRSWSASRHGTRSVHTILMCSNRNDIRALSRDRRNDTILRPAGMAKRSRRHARYARRSNHSLDLLEQPCRRLLARCALVVAVVEGNKSRQLALHVGRAELGEKGCDGGFLGDGGGEDCCAAGEGFRGGVEIGVFGDVHEVDAGLRSC